MVKSSGSGEAPSTSNPYITKTISKTLLTPCRQIGLSRKRKTPNNLLTSTNKSLLSHLDTTPSPSSLQIESKIVSESKVESKTPTVVDSKIGKKVSRCLPMVDQNSIETKTEVEERTISVEQKKVITPKTDKKKTSKDNVKKTSSHRPVRKKHRQSEDETSSSTDEEFLALKLNRGKKEIVQPKKKLRVISDDESSSQEVKEPKDVTATKTHSSSRNSFVEISIVEEKLGIIEVENPKVIDNSSGSQEENIKHNPVKLKERINVENDDLLVEKKIQLTVDNCPNSQGDRSTSAKENVALERKPKLLRRSLSMKKSNSDERVEKEKSDYQLKNCSVHLKSLEEVNEKNSKVAGLEKTVIEKRRLLEDLKQAEIYKKIHNIENLKQLTSTWKTGCISALKDLLPQLNSHANIDMATLLSNLRVPKNLITLTSDGELM